MAGFITANQLAGPPIGAALFAAGMAWPFVAQALFVALGAVLVSRIVLRPGPSAGRTLHVRRDIVEGCGGCGTTRRCGP